MGVAVEVDLAVEGDDLPLLGDDERIDFEEGAILFDEELVEVRRKSDEPADLIFVEAEREADASRLVGGEPDDRIDVDTVDLLRRVVCDLFDVHPALGRRHDRDTADVAIDHDLQVELAADVETLLDGDPANDLA